MTRLTRVFSSVEKGWDPLQEFNAMDALKLPARVLIEIRVLQIVRRNKQCGMSMCSLMVLTEDTYPGEPGI